jgi:hypothetical protein
MKFTPHEHLIQIKSQDGLKDYLQVQWRLVWFREACPAGTISTTFRQIDLDRLVEKEIVVWNAEKRRSEKVLKSAQGWAYFEVRVEDGHGAYADGVGSECAVDFGDFIEKAHTKAVGRALAALGYGTQFVGDEFNEAHRIVDAPVDSQHTRAAAPQSATSESSPDQITAQQVSSIQKLCQHLGKAEPEGLQALTFANAKALIAQLSKEYREAQQASRSGK